MFALLAITALGFSYDEGLISRLPARRRYSDLQYARGEQDSFSSDWPPPPESWSSSDDEIFSEEGIVERLERLLRAERMIGELQDIYERDASDLEERAAFDFYERDASDDLEERAAFFESDRGERAAEESLDRLLRELEDIYERDASSEEERAAFDFYERDVSDDLEERAAFFESDRGERAAEESLDRLLRELEDIYERDASWEDERAAFDFYERDVSAEERAVFDAFPERAAEERLERLLRAERMIGELKDIYERDASDDLEERAAFDFYERDVSDDLEERAALSSSSPAKFTHPTCENGVSPRSPCTNIGNTCIPRNDPEFEEKPQGFTVVFLCMEGVDEDCDPEATSGMWVCGPVAPEWRHMNEFMFTEAGTLKKVDDMVEEGWITETAKTHLEEPESDRGERAAEDSLDRLLRELQDIYERGASDDLEELPSSSSPKFTHPTCAATQKVGSLCGSDPIGTTCIPRKHPEFKDKPGRNHVFLCHKAVDEHGFVDKKAAPKWVDVSEWMFTDGKLKPVNELMELLHAGVVPPLNDEFEDNYN